MVTWTLSFTRYLEIFEYVSQKEITSANEAYSVVGFDTWTAIIIAHTQFHTLTSTHNGQSKRFPKDSQCSTVYFHFHSCSRIRGSLWLKRLGIETQRWGEVRNHENQEVVHDEGIISSLTVERAFPIASCSPHLASLLPAQQFRRIPIMAGDWSRKTSRHLY